MLVEWAGLVAHEDKMPFSLLAAASQQVTVPWASRQILAETWGAGSVPIPPACL